MAEPPSKRPRVTPRNSDANNAGVDEDDDATPYSNLRQLAGSLVQPSRTPQHASSAGPSTNRTPGTASQRTPRAQVRQFPVARRVGAPTTPHAIRALKARRDAALAASGSKHRRRSGVAQRETPRDFLRALSRRLAGTSQPVQPSPQVKSKSTAARDDDFDEGPDLPRPRLSMPLHDDDDSFHEAPPRLSLALDDVDMENATMVSIEGGRRAVSEDPRQRLSRSSFGRVRLSERFAGDLDDLSEDGAEMYDDGTVGPLVFDGDAENVLDEEMTDRFGDDTTQELRTMLASQRRSRPSDINLPAGADLDEEPTFRFVMPGHSRDPSLLVAHDAEDDDEAAEDEDDMDIDADAGVGAEEDYETASDEDDVERHLREDSLSRTAAAADETSAGKMSKTRGRRKSLKVSKFGHEYPSLSLSVVKRLATSFARLHGGGGPTAKLSKDTLDAVVQASDWFFEQVSEDLGSYAEHAGRKTIEEADVVALMNRQRQINNSTTPFSLAQKYLPRELLQEIRMPRAAPKAKKSRKRSRMETIEEEDGDE